MNHLYGYGLGMLPPFRVHSEDSRSYAKHCSNGIEPRVSSERLILLDSQPMFSPSVLAEMMRPDGSSTVAILGTESLSAELAHEIMSIQVDLLKHWIPDPSALFPTHFQTPSAALEKEYKDKLLAREDYMTAPVFVHTKLHNQEINPRNILPLMKALLQNFRHSSSVTGKFESSSLCPDGTDLGFVNELPIFCEIGEREWLKNSAKIWEMVKNYSVTAEYGRTL